MKRAKTLAAWLPWVGCVASLVVLGTFLGAVAGR